MRRDWFDPRAILLAALLALAAALPVMTTSVERREYYFFDITLTCNSVGSTQFFWDQGKGFSESDSSRQPIKVEPNPVVYRFMMPMGRFRALRFDPIDGIGHFTLSHAQIVDRRGRIMRVFGPDDFQPAANIVRSVRHGLELWIETDPNSNDPYLYLRMDEPLELPSGADIWWELGSPVATPVFLIGLLLGMPAVARRLSTLTGKVADVARRRPILAISFAAASAVAVQCHPVLFQSRSFVSANNGGHMLYEQLPTLPGDTDPMSTHTGSSDTGALLFQHLYYPMVQRDALTHGELPLWNRYSLCGEPLLGQGQSMFGDPFNLITIAADGAAWAWDLRFILAHWIMAASLGGIVWLLTRRLGAASLVAAAAAFLGFYGFRLCHPANFSVCYAPTILLAWTGLGMASTSRRTMLWLLAIVASNWLVMTSGTVKEAYMLMVGLDFAGALLLWSQPKAAAHRLRLLCMAAAAGFGFVLLSAPLWLTFLNAWGHSMTGYDVPQAQTLPWSQFLGFFDDLFYRQAQKDENVVAPALNFIFLLGFLWWFIQPSAWRTGRSGWYLLAAATPPFALAFGLVPASVIVMIPFVGNIVHVGNTFSCVLLILLAVLAGLGFRDAWDRLKDPTSHRVIARMLVAGIMLAGIYLIATRHAGKSPFFTGYAVALGLATTLLPLGIRWGLLRPDSPGPLWVVVAIGLPLLCWRHTQYRSSSFDRYVFTPGPRSDYHAPSPAVSLLNPHRTAPGRVVGWGSNLYASYNTVLRWESVYGVDAVRSRYFHELADALRLERVWNWDWPNRESDSVALIRRYDLYNVTHYIATHQAGPHPISGLQTLEQADLDVYASPTAWPRAFFCDQVVRYGNPADFARLLLEGDGRPFAAVQSGEKSAPAPGASPDRRFISPARDYRFTPNNTAFPVEATGPGVAVLTETYYLDDFHVTVNGKPAGYFRVNHSFRGVALPSAGTYQIEYRYWPRFFTASLWSSFLGLLLLIGGATWLGRQTTPPTQAA